MGDTPTEIPNEQICPGSIWQNERVPNIITVEFSGLSEVDPPITGFPSPPDGAVNLLFSACVGWYAYHDDFYTTVTVYSDNFEIFCRSNPYAVVFAAGGKVSGPVSLDNDNPMWSAYKNEGHIYVDLFLGGSHPPQSWVPAPLVGVPPVSGYFAEQGFCGLSDKNYRYANHANGTNVKVIMI